MKRRTRLNGPVATALSGLYGCQEPKLIAKSLAVGLLYAHKETIKGPPFSPFEYAKLLGVKVEFKKIEAEGVFVDDPVKGATILLQKHEGLLKTFQERRLNFTLAHEIGHFVIRKALRGLVPPSALLTEDAEEEMLCNVFAAELLMPGIVIRKDLEEFGLDPDSLVRLSSRYEVSLQSLLCCAMRLVQGEVAAVLWERDEREYSVYWASRSAFRNLILCDTGRTTVERAVATGKQQAGADTLMLNGQRMRWRSVSHKLLSSSKVLTVMRRSFTSSYRFLPPAEPIVPPSPPVKTVPIQILLPLEAPQPSYARMRDDIEWDDSRPKKRKRSSKPIH